MTSTCCLMHGCLTRLASRTQPHAWLPRSPGLMHGCLAHLASCMAASRTRPHAWLPRAPGLMHGCLAHQASCMATSRTRPHAWLPRGPSLLHGYLAHLASCMATSRTWHLPPLLWPTGTVFAAAMTSVCCKHGIHWGSIVLLRPLPDLFSLCEALH